jgi:NitT/TauT family transport system substrate-binding protein
VLVVTGNSRITMVSQLAGRMIGVNGDNSIGTLLVAALLSAHGISLSAVKFVTDPDGFPAMPGTLQHGAWDAAFLAEPYITAAGQQYGQQVLADLDQGAVLSLPVDGYVVEADVKRVATAMLKFGVLSPRYATVVGQGTLVRSMVSPG